MHALVSEQGLFLSLHMYPSNSSDSEGRRKARSWAQLQPPHRKPTKVPFSSQVSPVTAASFQQDRSCSLWNLHIKLHLPKTADHLHKLPCSLDHREPILDLFRAIKAISRAYKATYISHLSLPDAFCYTSKSALFKHLVTIVEKTGAWDSAPGPREHSSKLRRFADLPRSATFQQSSHNKPHCSVSGDN